MSIRIALAVTAFTASAFTGWLIHRTPTEADSGPLVVQQRQIPEPARPESRGPAGPAIVAAPCDDSALAALNKENQRLADILGVLAHNQAGYEALDKGVPLSFPEQTPDRFQREGFEANLQRALGELENPPELVSVDCSECPCIAALKTQGDLAGAIDLSCRLRESRTWREKYDEPGHQGETQGHCPYVFGDLNAVVPKSCGQDRTERYVLVSPIWDCMRGEGFSAAQYAQNIQQRANSGRLHELWEAENQLRRTTMRQRELVDNQQCGDR